MKLERIFDLIASDMKAVDALIHQKLQSDVLLARQVTDYIIDAGGKRLRPALVLLSAGTQSYGGTLHVKLAAIVEIVHTATLLHDDVVDESDLRRNRKTANALFGNAASILVGDFLYSRAFQMMVEVDDMHIMRVLSDATNIIAGGEVLQLMNCHDANIGEERYLQIIRDKTAKLFETASRAGAIISDAPPDVEECLADYGAHLGTAFQLIDDVLDYSGAETDTGKHLGDDLAEGKPTLPLIYAMQHGTAEQANCVRQAIEHGGRDRFPEVLAVIRATGALEYTRKQAEVEARRAQAAIGTLTASSYKDSLLELASFAVDRTF